MFSDEHKDKIILVVQKYSDELDLPNRGGGDYVHQSDEAQIKAVEMLGEIADVVETIEEDE